MSMMFGLARARSCACWQHVQQSTLAHGKKECERFKFCAKPTRARLLKHHQNSLCVHWCCEGVRCVHRHSQGLNNPSAFEGSHSWGQPQTGSCGVQDVVAGISNTHEGPATAAGGQIEAEQGPNAEQLLRAVSCCASQPTQHTQTHKHTGRSFHRQEKEAHQLWYLRTTCSSRISTRSSVSSSHGRRQGQPAGRGRECQRAAALQVLMSAAMVVCEACDCSQHCCCVSLPTCSKQAAQTLRTAQVETPRAQV